MDELSEGSRRKLKTDVTAFVLQEKKTKKPTASGRQLSERGFSLLGDSTAPLLGRGICLTRLLLHPGLGVVSTPWAAGEGKLSTHTGLSSGRLTVS